MTRIAKVKFGQNSKAYDYICDNKKIMPGDIVYVEGQARPYFVYDIVETESSDLKATKRIVGLAVENPNVRLSNRYMDITKCTATAIANSLGTNIREFGEICGSIVSKANSKEINDMISNHPRGNVFDTFITDAGDLPSKHIIHIVMPFKKQDSFNRNLKKAFEIIIDLAIKEGYDSIAIPFIGTGANGYSKNDVYEALNDTMFKYQYKQGISIHIISVNFNSTKHMGRETDKEKLYYSKLDTPICCGIGNPLDAFEPDIHSLEQFQYVRKLIATLYHPEEEIQCSCFDVSEYSPGHFVDDCRKNRYEETKSIVEEFGYNLGKVDANGIEHKGKTVYSNMIKKWRSKKQLMKKEHIYRLSKRLKLNFTQIIQFMDLCGYSFSPISENNIDYEVFYYIAHNDGFTKPYHEIEEYFYSVIKDEALLLALGFDTENCYV